MHPPEHGNECHGDDGIVDPVRARPVLLLPCKYCERNGCNGEYRSDDRHREDRSESSRDLPGLYVGNQYPFITRDPWQQDIHKRKNPGGFPSDV